MTSSPKPSKQASFASAAFAGLGRSRTYNALSRTRSAASSTLSRRSRVTDLSLSLGASDRPAGMSRASWRDTQRERRELLEALSTVSVGSDVAEPNRTNLGGSLSDVYADLLPWADDSPASTPPATPPSLTGSLDLALPRYLPLEEPLPTTVVRDPRGLLDFTVEVLEDNGRRVQEAEDRPTLWERRLRPEAETALRGPRVAVPAGSPVRGDRDTPGHTSVWRNMPVQQALERVWAALPKGQGGQVSKAAFFTAFSRVLLWLDSSIGIASSLRGLLEERWIQASHGRESLSRLAVIRYVFRLAMQRSRPPMPRQVARMLTTFALLIAGRLAPPAGPSAAKARYLELPRRHSSHPQSQTPQESFCASPRRRLTAPAEAPPPAPDSPATPPRPLRAPPTPLRPSWLDAPDPELPIPSGPSAPYTPHTTLLAPAPAGPPAVRHVPRLRRLPPGPQRPPSPRRSVTAPGAVRRARSVMRPASQPAVDGSAGLSRRATSPPHLEAPSTPVWHWDPPAGPPPPPLPETTAPQPWVSLRAQLQRPIVLVEHRRLFGSPSKGAAAQVDPQFGLYRTPGPPQAALIAALFAMLLAADLVGRLALPLRPSSAASGTPARPSRGPAPILPLCLPPDADGPDGTAQNSSESDPPGPPFDMAQFFRGAPAWRSPRRPAVTLTDRATSPRPSSPRSPAACPRCQAGGSIPLDVAVEYAQFLLRSERLPRVPTKLMELPASPQTALTRPGRRPEGFRGHAALRAQRPGAPVPTETGPAAPAEAVARSLAAALRFAAQAEDAAPATACTPPQTAASWPGLPFGHPQRAQTTKRSHNKGHGKSAISPLPRRTLFIGAYASCKVPFRPRTPAAPAPATPTLLTPAFPSDDQLPPT